MLFFVMGAVPDSQLYYSKKQRSCQGCLPFFTEKGFRPAAILIAVPQTPRCQISSLYSAMVLSEEKNPALLILIRARLVQS